MPPKKRVKIETEEKRKKDLQQIDEKYKFFVDFPPTRGSKPSIALECEMALFWVDGDTVRACSPFLTMQKTKIVSRKEHIELPFAAKGVKTFAQWANSHEKPCFDTLNGVSGDILDHAILSYSTAMSLEVPQLYNSIMRQICEVGGIHHLRIRVSHIADAFERKDLIYVQKFLVAMVAYQQGCRIPGPFLHGPNNRKDKARRFKDYLETPTEFKYALNEATSAGVYEDPCSNPKEFFGEFLNMTIEDETIFVGDD